MREFLSDLLSYEKEMRDEKVDALGSDVGDGAARGRSSHSAGRAGE
jgi:hypothetical protein